MHVGAGMCVCFIRAEFFSSSFGGGMEELGVMRATSYVAQANLIRKPYICLKKTTARCRKPSSG